MLHQESSATPTSAPTPTKKQRVILRQFHTHIFHSRLFFRRRSLAFRWCPTLVVFLANAFFTRLILVEALPDLDVPTAAELPSLSSRWPFQPPSSLLSSSSSSGRATGWAAGLRSMSRVIDLCAFASPNSTSTRCSVANSCAAIHEHYQINNHISTGNCMCYFLTCSMTGLQTLMHILMEGAAGVSMSL